MKERILSFAQLLPNWDSYGADPINPVSIQKALLLAEVLPGEWEVFPMRDGGIQFEYGGIPFEYGDQEIEIHENFQLLKFDEYSALISHQSFATIPELIKNL